LNQGFNYELEFNESLVFFDFSELPTVIQSFHYSKVFPQNISAGLLRVTYKPDCDSMNDGLE
jgi:hypothetical protein